MATKHIPTSVPPWIWAMEALASCNEVKDSLLIDLMVIAPDMSSKMWKDAREFISFRILESLLGKIVSSPPVKISFELSKRCEDVLSLILNESRGSKLKLSDIDVSKYDIEPFLTHKRSCMPNVSLQQIKDSMQGTHPLLAQLKEESGFARSDKFEAVNPNNEDQEALAIMGLIHLSSGKIDNHLQRESTDRNLADDITIGHPPFYPQRNEILEANGNDNPQEIPSIDDEDSRDESGESIQNESAHDSFVLNKPSASGDKADVTNIDGNIHNYLTSVATKMGDFLSSQSPELNLCIKCNKNGRLLVCSSATCSIIVHENCLPSAPTLHEGKFYCPSCLYSRALSEYMDSKEKALLARKKFMIFSDSKVPCSGPHTRINKCGKDGDEKNKAKSVSNMSEDEIPRNRQLAIYVPENGTKKCDGEHLAPDNADKDESSEKESDESGASDFPVGSRNKEKPNRWPAYLGRRKKLPWTDVEEEKLKEGVERFSKVNENMPWKIILEFGCNVFHKGRTTIDLKDKWRNLQKKL